MSFLIHARSNTSLSEVNELPTNNHQMRYALNQDRVIETCKKLVGSRSRYQSKKMYGVFILRGSDCRSDIGRTLEKEVFYEYFANNEDTFVKEYGKYEDNSTFIVVIDQRRYIPVGVVRILNHEGEGHKTINDLLHEDSPWNVAGTDIYNLHGLSRVRTLDIATMAVKRRYRSKFHRKIIRSLLFHSIYSHACEYGASHWVAILDDVHIRSFSLIGVPINSIGGAESKPYLGSVSSRPIFMSLDAINNEVRKNHRFNHWLLVRGSLLRKVASF